MQNVQPMLSNLKKVVQQNCDIADASHAGDYTLCIYLLKMRELYRWEQKESFSKNLANKTVGIWLRQREELWENLEDADFVNIEIENQSISPFESDRINSTLKQHQLVYSGGMGINNRPHFFLADLDLYEEHKDYSLYIAGKEYVRDMAAPPAMSHQNTIYIRKESFQRLLWEKLETWRWNKPDNALGRAFSYYDCENNLDNALLQMTDVEIENVIQHERGEILAGDLLGDQWHTLLYALPHSKTAIMLRAIRDHLADSLTTLPNLLKMNSAPSWHFYFGNLNNMRKDLYPSLTDAYNHWYKTGSQKQLASTIEQAAEHWLRLCQKIMQFNEINTKSQQQIIQLIEKSRL